MDVEKVGKFISEIRKSKKLTQAKLAQLTGASDKTISKWETGGGFPDVQYQAKLCEVLGIFLEELHKGEYNTSLRRKIKRRKIINILSIIYIVITVPLLFWLSHFFITNYNTTKIYELKILEKDVEIVTKGLIIKTNKTNMMYIGNIDVWQYQPKETDIISVDVYSGDTLIYHNNNLSYIWFKFEKNIVLNNLKIKISITDIKNNAKEYNANLGIVDVTNASNEIEINNKTIEILSDEQIIENLKNNGFKKLDDRWQKVVKDKSAKETIEYYSLNEQIMYKFKETKLYKKISYNLKTNDLEVYIFHDSENIHSVIEKYTYDYDNKKINCIYGPCSTLEEVLKIMKKYRSLLIVE